MRRQSFLISFKRHVAIEQGTEDGNVDPDEVEHRENIVGEVEHAVVRDADVFEAADDGGGQRGVELFYCHH